MFSLREADKSTIRQQWALRFLWETFLALPSSGIANAAPMYGCTGRRASGRATVSIGTSACCCTRSPRVRIRHSSFRTRRAARDLSRRSRPIVAVEKRPLAVYARLTGGLS
jgi:hypothetical protein